MTDEAKTEAEKPAGDKADWNTPKPDVIPRPTYAPAAMAFGLTFFFWGFVTSPVVFLVGVLIVAAALANWIREMRHE